MRIVHGLLVLSVLSLACAGDPGPAPAPRPVAEAAPPGAGPATTQPAPSPSAAAGGAPAAQGCGPAVADQATNVRAAALDALMTQALKDATAKHTTLGPIVLAEESRLGPGGQVFLHDTSPEVVDRFTGHTPPVGNYSTAFKVENGHSVRDPASMTFTTGDICWQQPTRATVRARQLSAGVNRPYTATVEKKGKDWSVTALEPR
jgi:hypothetical protein